MNPNAGQNIQQAIADGKVKRCIGLKKDGSQCGRAACKDSDYCSAHPINSAAIETYINNEITELPANCTGYVEVLPDNIKAVYQQVFGDLTLVHEMAMAKSLLLQLLQRIQNDYIMISTASDINPIDQIGIGKRLKTEMNQLIKLLDTVTKISKSTIEQLQGKKITVTIQNDKQEVLDEVRELINQELVFMDKVLCPECRNRLADQLFERQRTTFE